METSDTTSTTAESRKSALQHNLEQKGKNAYYFAHAHKADGPAWDGKAEPKLLSRQASSAVTLNLTFGYTKSNIMSYAFLDDGAKVKLYFDLDNIGEKCKDEDITLDFTERSLYLEIRNYAEEPQTLRFARLTAAISDATYRLKTNRLIVALTKVDPETAWHTINDKVAPDHEVM